MAQNDEIILININGADRPGVTAALTEILAKNNAVILDIGQADIHNHLSLGILFQSTEGNSGDILKELLFKSYELDVNIRFNPITEQEYSKWVGMQGKNRYIITILSRKLTAKQIAGVSRIVAEQDMNIDDIKRLTLSVFKRRFAEHFNDSVYHWMMRQKALKVFSDIRDGEDSTKVLMNKYGFRHYTQFSRFCKNYLQATPAQLISSIKKK